MNQTQQLIDSIRDAPHDTVIVAGMFAIPVLIALWIVNRMRHPERGLLHALVIASVGFVLVPCVSSAVLILWVRTGGDSIQAAFVSMFVFVFGFWGFRRWLRSAPRAAKPTKALVAPAVHAAPRSGLAGEVAELRRLPVYGRSARIAAGKMLRKYRFTSAKRPLVIPSTSRPPFPSPWRCAILAVKGPLRRFAPWTLRADLGRRAVHEGKRGISGRVDGPKGSLPARSRLSFPGASRGRSRPIVARHISARCPQ